MIGGDCNMFLDIQMCLGHSLLSPGCRALIRAWKGQKFDVFQVRFPCRSGFALVLILKMIEKKVVHMGSLSDCLHEILCKPLATVSDLMQQPYTIAKISLLSIYSRFSRTLLSEKFHLFKIHLVCFLNTLRPGTDT